MRIVPLGQVTDPGPFGGKAFHLGAALRAGLPVPPGYGVSVDALSAVDRGDRAMEAELSSVLRELGAPVAARSSAVGEDGEGASFAGQHVSVLNVLSEAELVLALRRVRQSAHTEAAAGYRKKQGISTPVRIAAVVQKLVDPDAAGVLFTRNPVTGARERVVEAAWGLGEGVVAGLVTPDHYRVAEDGRILEVRPGEKDLAVRRNPSGGTEEVEVEPDRIHARCLDDSALGRLHALAARCEAHFGFGLDLEWAFVGTELFLLQSRPITAGRT